ncbi:MAG: hypothetical protein NTY32_14695 [Bacteroidia bacterium]|nr:hypothetical protein [Bacteroidia bacterium]
MQTQHPVLEYLGELLPDGHLSVPSDIVRQIEPGQKLKIRLEICMATDEKLSLAMDANEFLKYAKSVAQSGGYYQELITREFIHDRDI